MARYYVETHLPDGQRAEAFHEGNSFDDAFGWMDERLRANPRLIGRFLDRRGHITPEQAAKLTKYDVSGL
jgi:hypothetical protein